VFRRCLGSCNDILIPATERLVWLVLPVVVLPVVGLLLRYCPKSRNMHPDGV